MYSPTNMVCNLNIHSHTHTNLLHIFGELIFPLDYKFPMKFTFQPKFQKVTQSKSGEGHCDVCQGQAASLKKSRGGAFLAKCCPFHEKRWQLWKERGRAVIFASLWRPSQRWGEDLLTRVDLQENSDFRQRNLGPRIFLFLTWQDHLKV